MRVLVTGGLGFIGEPTVRELVARGHEVAVLDSADPSAHPAGPPRAALDGLAELGVAVTSGDVRDPAALDAALAGAGGVVHLAAKVGVEQGPDDWPAYLDANATGTAALLAAAVRAGCERLVLASSMVVYGEGAYRCERDGCPLAGPASPVARRPADLDAGDFEPRGACGHVLVPALVTEDAPLAPASGYALSKLAQEQLAALWGRRGGRTAAMRYHNVYGPGMPRDTPYAGVAAVWRSALEHGRAPQVYEDGGQRRDFVHVRDVARANASALERLDDVVAPGEVRAYNVASGQVRTVLDVARELSAALAGPAPQVTGAWRLGDVRHVTASPRRAREELGEAARVGFAEGLREFATAGLRA